MSTPPFIPARPPTPQAMLHRLPDKPGDDDDNDLEGAPAPAPPSRYIVLIAGSTGVAGKVQIATSVAAAFACPLYQGDSLHESSAKAASVGVGAGAGAGLGFAPNEARYERMWLSKMTRTGLLFPEVSRPATQGFAGFGGASSSSSSSSTSRRGSASSVASSAPSDSDASSSASGFPGGVSVPVPAAAPIPGSGSGARSATAQFINAPPAAPARPPGGVEGQQRAVRGGGQEEKKKNPALMVLTHPELERWHKLCIKRVVGEYGVGVLFVPLYDDDDFPQLRPLDPRTMTSFASSFGGPGGGGGAGAASGGGLSADDVVRVDIDGDVGGITDEVVQGVRAAMKIQQ